MVKKRQAIGLAVVVIFLLVTVLSVLSVSGTPNQDTWEAQPLHLVEPAAYRSGYTPAQIRQAYNLPSTGGAGTTIAIIVAYDAPNIESDLTTFSARYGLPAPSEENFEIKKMGSNLGTNSDWALETSLDVQWAHAIAPEAKILLVEAESPSISDLLYAIDFARNRPDVVSISMSWGDDEFYRQTTYNYHFTSSYGAVFFAATGDDGSGVMWPSSSANVVGVGGTTLYLDAQGNMVSETAWSGSGGGLSSYEARPMYQTIYGLTTYKRSVPDVAYNGDPNTGFAVCYNSVWHCVGGTSAGTPQWAAINALGRSAENANFYLRAKSTDSSEYFRDITTGSNGYFAQEGYDYVTGLGSPLTVYFADQTQTATLALLPAEDSTVLSSGNQFKVTYTLDDALMTTYAGNGNLTLTTDIGTNLLVEGTSTGSTATEKWVFNSYANSVSGTNMTLYYYDLLAQTTTYTAIGGAIMQAPSLSYVTAPATSGSQYAPQTVSLPLTQSTQTAWTQKGTTINATNPLSASTTERWSTQTATWTTQTPNQIAQTITYYQQYAVTFSYQAIGGTLPSTPTFTAVSYNQIKTIELTLTESSYWLDADSAYVVTSVLESSSASERWITNRPSGTISSELSVTANYYHQFNVPVDYASADENETVTFNYFSLGTLNSIELSSVPVQIWADAQATFTTNSINNTAYERWSALPDSGTIQNASAIHITLQHQYLLTIFGAQTSSQWVNSDQTVQLSFQTVLNRALGTGQRISAYTLDQGSAVTVSAATQNINIPILMDTSHQLRISTITQYQISIDAFAAQLLSSITPPTVSGDNYWYDSGTQVSVVLKGLGTRVGGVGTRLADYTVNDAQTSAATTDQVIVLNTTITAPQSISATLVTQYQLTTTAGSINTITEPTLPQDNGWYDAQTPVTITLNQVWNVTDNSRTIATAYTINQNSMPLTQSGNETFTIQVVMNSNKQITVTSVVQNRLTITGGHNVTVSQASPTGDDFYNSNTIVSVYVNTEWDTTESSKQVVSSYTLDGVTSSVSQTEPLLSIELSMDKAHELVFSSGLRCLVSFTIKDNSGTETLTPEVLQISLGNSTVDVENYDAWVMEQTQFQIGNVIWQGVDVKPQTQESYTVTGPLEVTVFCRVFNATIKLTDNNGATIENAQVIVTLANQTIVEAVTNGEGTVDLGMIPQGTFNATVIYKDKTITLTGDASVQAVTAGVIHLQNNYFIESVVFAVILFVIIACVLLIIIKQRAGK